MPVKSTTLPQADLIGGSHLRCFLVRIYYVVEDGNSASRLFTPSRRITRVTIATEGVSSSAHDSSKAAAG